MNKGAFSDKYIVMVQYTCNIFTTEDKGNLSLDDIKKKIEDLGGISKILYPLELVNNEDEVSIEIDGYDSEKDTTKVWYKNLRLRVPVFISAVSENAAKALAKKKVKVDTTKFYNVIDIKDITVEEVVKGRKILEKYGNLLRR